MGERTCLGCIVCSMFLEQDFNIKAILGWDHDDVVKLNWRHLALMAKIYVAIVGVAKPIQAKNSDR